MTTLSNVIGIVQSSQTEVVTLTVYHDDSLPHRSHTYERKKSRIHMFQKRLLRMCNKYITYTGGVRKKIAEHMMPSVGTQLVGVQIFSIILQFFSIPFLMVLTT